MNAMSDANNAGACESRRSVALCESIIRIESASRISADEVASEMRPGIAPP